MSLSSPARGQPTLTTTSAVTELTRLLHEHGDKILSGKAMLSLTTESLAVLNNGFDAIREDAPDKSFDVLSPNHSPLTVLPELQFIHDFVQKTPSLRLVHGNNTIQGSISLQTFRSLVHLEMRRIPVHLLQGLQRVRSKLVVLSIERCLHQLQDLFETIPTDSTTTSLSWTALEKVYLSYNFVEHLDGSLRLLPAVKLLDVSHNGLKSTDAYLGYLTELVHLNLSFNSLSTIPSLSMSSQARLRTLVLANNHIDNLAGLELLRGLEVLDLSNNLLCDHGILGPLRRLGALKELFLAFNPLVYRKKHRSSTAAHLAPVVMATVLLDGKAFSPSELAYARVVGGARRQVQQGHNVLLTGSRVDLLSSTDDRGDEDDNERGATDSLTRSLQSRASVRRIRSVQINDLDELWGDEHASAVGPSLPEDSTVVTHVTPLRNEIASARQEIEARRRQLGDTWLTSLVTSSAPVNSPLSQSTPVGAAPGCDVPNGCLPKDAPAAGVSQLFDQSSAAIVTAASASFGLPPDVVPPAAASHLSQPVHMPSAGRTPLEGLPALRVLEMVTLGNTAVSTSNHCSRTLSCSRDSVAPAHVNSGQLPADLVMAVAHSAHDASAALTGGSCAGVCRSSSTVNEPASNEKGGVDENPVWKDVIEDEDNGSVDEEPFIVYQLGSGPASSEPCLVTVSGHYLVEKDHNGRLLDKLDLNMLLQTGITNTEEQRNSAVVNLKFNYVRRDRRERSYLMEDEQNAEHLMMLLKPMLDLRPRSSATDGILQCLRCNHKFTRLAADVRIHHRTVTLHRNEKEAAAVSEALHCPSCGSPQIVNDEDEQLAVTLKAGLPRTGSVGSLFSAAAAGSSAVFEPAATSSRNTTPVKPVLSAAAALRALSPREQRSAASAGGTPLYGSLCNVSESSSFHSFMEDSAAASLYQSAENLGPRPSSRPVSRESALSGRRSTPSGASSAGSSRETTLCSEATVAEVGSVHRLSPLAKVLCAANTGHSVVPMSNMLQAAVSKIIPGGSTSATTGEVIPAGSLDLDSDEGSNITATRVTGQFSHVAVTVTAVAPSNIAADSGRAMAAVLGRGLDLMPNGSAGSSDTGGEPLVTDSGTLGSRLNPAEAAPGSHAQEAATPAPPMSSDKLPAATGAQRWHGDDSVVEEFSKLTFRFDDFTAVDHRLKLLLSMDYFSDDETCECVLLSPVVQHNTASHFTGVLVLSTTAIYILKITRPHTAIGDGLDLSAVISLAERQQLVDLCYVDIALNHQNLRLEFERSGYCFLVRDEMRCKAFMAVFTGIVRRVAFDSSCRLQAISKIHGEYLECFSNWIQDDDDRDNCTATASDSDVTGSSEPYYCMAQLRCGDCAAAASFTHRGLDSEADALEPVSLFVTDSSLYVMKENAYLPLSRCSNGSIKQSYFSIRFRVKMADVAHVNIFHDLPHDVEVETFKEESSGGPAAGSAMQSRCHFVMATEAAVIAFVDALGARWQALFGIELQINSLAATDSASE